MRKVPKLLALLVGLSGLIAVEERAQSALDGFDLNPNGAVRGAAIQSVRKIHLADVFSGNVAFSEIVPDFGRTVFGTTTAPNGNTLVVTNTNDTGTGSLRQAITDSNNLPGTQIITFQIPGAGVQTIASLSGLPVITGPVIIDGYTQPGASANTLPDDDNAVLLIELDGTSVTGGTPGLDIAAGNSVVQGLVINRFSTSIRLRTNGGNVVAGCFIGTDATGLAAPAGSGQGIAISGAANNTIGGINPVERNLISGGNGSGINIGGAGAAANNIVQGNFIGTDRHGTGALGNSAQGIALMLGIVNTMIGGTSAGARNVISANASSGIISTTTGTGLTIQGNFIGTDVTGTAPLGNGSDGISHGGATGALIGGAAAGAGNVICANRLSGININGGTGPPVVQGNFIGTDLTATLDLGNAQNGISISGQPAMIGGTSPGEGNTIAFNGSGNGVATSKNGVLIFATGVSVLGNSIHSNVGLGIDLSPAYGVTPNDVCDGDTGANNLQNYPVITSASPSGGNTIITGSLNSTANTQFRVEFFSNATCDTPGGHGEGQTFLGSIAVTTDANCNASINTTLPGATTPGQVVTATATDPNGNTSEFSACQAVTGPALPVITSPLVATGILDLPFTYQFTASGATSLAVSNLPPGLMFFMTPPPNPLPIAIVGKPTATGTFQVGLSATNSQGTTTTTLTITVQQVPTSGPIIISSTAATGRVGQPFFFKVYTRGGNPATARLSASGLPPGLVVNAVPGVNGLISGTPTAEGSSAITLTVTDPPFTTSSTLQLTFTADPTLPVIISPSSASLTPGQPFSYTINAPSSAGPSDPTIFSAFDVNDLPAGLTFNAATGTISGIYSPSPGESARSGEAHEPELGGGILLGSIQLFATNGHGTSTIQLTLLRTPVGVLNISTRLLVGTGENVLIGGFIITGNAPEVVIIRAIGPSLSAVGIQGALQDTLLELHDSANHVVSNDNWRDSQQDLINFTDIPPSDNRESALVIGLDPGNYTAIVAGKNGATGIALVEVYDLGTGSLDISGLARLANISTRGFVNTGDNAMIGGFIIQGEARRVIVRAIGPSLSASGIQGALQDTVLELHDGSGSLIFSNDNWRSTQEQEIIATGLPPADNRESAIVAHLVPGAYTAIVRGQANTTGVALVEVYALE